MDQSRTRKILDVAVALLREPTDAPRYLRMLPAWRKQPLDHALPWYSFGAIDRLKARLRPTDRVFEYGGGGSTLFYAQRTASVTVAESHAGWASVINDATRLGGFDNVSLALHPLDDDNADGYLTHSFFSCIENGAPWDVISVDCFCGFRTGGRGGALRPHALSLARRCLADNGCIVLDDSWMYPDEIAHQPGWIIENFAGLGPCRYGVTSTAIITRTTHALHS